MATLALIINQASGAGSPSPGRQTLSSLFEAHGLSVRIHTHTPGGDLGRLLDAALADAPAGLVAAGGDGTINAVATRAIETGLPLGVLPAGTLNHFARDLGVDAAIARAVEVIAAGYLRDVDVGIVNDRIFLNNASIGLYATMVVDRERQRRRLGRGKWTAFFRANWAALRDPKPFVATVCVDGRDMVRSTPLLFVGNNDYIVQGPEAGAREHMDSGLLSVYVLHPHTALGLLWLAVRTLVRGVSGAHDLDALTATSLSVASSSDHVDVARDGEVESMATPVCFTVRPAALRVFAPRPGMT